MGVSYGWSLTAMVATVTHTATAFCTDPSLFSCNAPVQCPCNFIGDGEGAGLNFAPTLLTIFTFFSGNALEGDLYNSPLSL